MDIRDIIEELEEQIEHFRLTRQEKIEVLERLDSHPLSDAIADQLGVEDGDELIQTLQDVCRGGANAGFGGFVYHDEIKTFFTVNKDTLIDLLVEESKLRDKPILEMIQDWKGVGHDYSIEDIRAVLHYNKQIPTIIDAICWFALEDFARLAE